MSTDPQPPPFVDEHSIVVEAPPQVVWDALRQHVTALGFGARNPLSSVLGTRPHSGFELTAEVPIQQLTLTGRHRFSRYALVFRLDEEAGRTRVRALTYAEFPGLRGCVYSSLVIGSRAHVVATRGILRTVRRRSLTAARDPGPGRPGG